MSQDDATRNQADRPFKLKNVGGAGEDYSDYAQTVMALWLCSPENRSLQDWFQAYTFEDYRRNERARRQTENGK